MQMNRTGNNDNNYRNERAAPQSGENGVNPTAFSATTKTSCPVEAPRASANSVSGLFRGGQILLDRTLALLIGVGVGSAIGISFVGGASSPSKAAVETLHAQAPIRQVVAQSARSAGDSAARVAFSADSAAPFQRALLNKISAGQPIVVGVFGDSFGDGIWTALYRRLPRDGAYQVLKFSAPSTGFVRTAPRDVQAETDAQLAQTPVDIALVDFGANDTQGIAQDGKAYPLLSPGWRAVYGARVDRYVEDLRAHGAMVYWVGLPKMRKPGYDAEVGALNAFYAQRMAVLGVPWLDVAPLSEDAAGDFADYLPTPGSDDPKLMRAGDGIHMTVAGYERIAAPAVQHIEAYMARARAAAELDAPVQVASVAAKGAAPADRGGR
jgi:hypothetical protein